MTNPMKGEVEVQLGDKSYSCRLTLDSLIKIATALDTGILKIAQNMAEGNVRLSDVISILLPALRGGGNDLQQKDVIKIVEEVGIVRSTVVAAELLASTISDPQGETEGKKPETKA